MLKSYFMMYHLTLSLTIKKYKIEGIIDNGTSNNYMSKKVVNMLQLTVIQHGIPLKVELVGGLVKSISPTTETNLIKKNRKTIKHEVN